MEDDFMRSPDEQFTGELIKYFQSKLYAEGELFLMHIDAMNVSSEIISKGVNNLMAKGLSFEDMRTIMIACLDKWIDSIIGHHSSITTSQLLALNENLSEEDSKLRDVELLERSGIFPYLNRERIVMGLSNIDLSPLEPPEETD